MPLTAEELHTEARALRLKTREHDRWAWRAEGEDDGQAARQHQRLAAELRARADRAWWRAEERV